MFQATFLQKPWRNESSLNAAPWEYMWMLFLTLCRTIDLVMSNWNDIEVTSPASQFCTSPVWLHNAVGLWPLEFFFIANVGKHSKIEPSDFHVNYIFCSPIISKWFGTESNWLYSPKHLPVNWNQIFAFQINTCKSCLLAKAMTRFLLFH